MSLISNVFRKLFKVTLLFFPLIIGLCSILFPVPKAFTVTLFIIFFKLVVFCLTIKTLAFWSKWLHKSFSRPLFRRKTFFFNECNYLELFQLNMLVGGWEDTQSVQKVCKPVHRDIPGWTPSGPASCWRTGQRSETRLLLRRPGLWSPSTAQTWGCMVVASATHPSGCSWTSQSWWLWRNDSTQRLWTSPKPGTANGKPAAATAVAAVLKPCNCFCLIES